MQIRYDPRAIRRLRLQRRLGREALAARAKVSYSTLYVIERGRTHPRASTLARLASVLGVRVDDFYIYRDPAA